MPYKLVTQIKEQTSGVFYDVIDMKLSRSKKVLKLFMDEESAEVYAKRDLKMTDDQFKVIEVETAYDYEPSASEQRNALEESGKV